jgi:oligoribonuclease NrnB/cAMP/cGMP phosphodiesterase (DHH superfamily)
MRLLTRSDFDGICCAVLLKELGIIDSMEYAHPKDLQDGKISVGADDVLANVPFVEGAGLWFDHHSSELERENVPVDFKGRSEAEKSCARVIYNYYDGKGLDKYNEMLKFVDLVDSASFEKVDDILNPTGWILLGFICDPRTGLGYHQEYRIGNLQLMEDLVSHIMGKSIDDILALPDVKERAVRYFANNEIFKTFLKEHSRVDGPIIITDTRGKDDIPPGNRFLVYSLHPEANIDVRLIDGRQGKTVAISVGHSVLNRTSNVDVGALMLKYGGGGHKQVGTCQVDVNDSETVIAEIVEAIKAS